MARTESTAKEPIIPKPDSPLNLHCVQTRDDLFPPAAAAELGLDPHTYATLEVERNPDGKDTQDMYTSVSEYIAAKGVDVHAELKLKKKDSDVAAESAGAENADAENADADGKGGNENDKDNENEDGEDTDDEDDEAPKLSSLRTTQARCYFSEDSCSDYSSNDGSDTESDSDEESEGADAPAHESSVNGAGEKADGCGGKSEEDNPLRKEKIVASDHRYYMGLGYAKVAMGEQTVYAYHYSLGPPNFNSMYRAVVLAGESQELLTELCSTARRWFLDKMARKVKPAIRENYYSLYRFKTDGSGGGCWMRQESKRSRPVSSVILREGQADAIVNDFEDFMSRGTKRWYNKHGLPYRRSYLFYGPPGTGKSSMCKALTGLFKLNACFLSLTQADFSNQVLHDALESIPQRPLLVLEDVDVLFHENRESQTNTHLTFSGLLNMLDGLVSVDGILTIMTTNHLERLDDALLRGGRVDRRFAFNFPDQKQVESLFYSFYPDASEETGKSFAEQVFRRKEKYARSIATLQQHFIFTRKKNAEECAEALNEFFEEFYRHEKATPATHIYG